MIAVLDIVHHLGFLKYPRVLRSPKLLDLFKRPVLSVDRTCFKPCMLVVSHIN